MVSDEIQILDSGLNKVGGAILYPRVNSGSWIGLNGFTLRGEFTVTSTDHSSTLDDPSDSGKLTFKSNALTKVLTPRYTLQGVILASDSQKIKDIVELSRTKGIKQLSGGTGLIKALPEASLTSPVFIYVLVKNITFSEVEANGDTYINFTIQLEQVR